MKGKHLITEYNGYIKSREELDNLEYYNKYYIKDKHTGAESGCVYLDDKIKIKIYGVNENDPSKDESGDMHVHIYTEFGESEYYVDSHNKTIKYKDGYKFSDEYVNNLINTMCGEASHLKGIPVFDSIILGWNAMNQENKKTFVYYK
jgi:hypothetical protein